MVQPAVTARPAAVPAKKAPTMVARPPPERNAAAVAMPLKPAETPRPAT